MTEGNKRILVIDDDVNVRDSIRLVLEAQGYEVDVACDGDKGIQLFKSCPFDIAIIDLLMPNKEGIETIKDLKKEFSDLVILAISGGSSFANIDYLDLAKKMGATSTLQKPFTAFDLVDAVKQISIEKG